MTDLLVLPSYYFGPVSWYAALLHGPRPVIHQGLTYRKQQFFSRMHIRHAQGMMPLSLPILRRGERKPLVEKRISYQEDWPRHHWRSIRFAYQNAPYFMYYEEELMALYASRSERLVDWHDACLNWVCETLDVSVPERTVDPALEEKGREMHQHFDPTLRTTVPWMRDQPYTQVFEGYFREMSILDLICNLGPESKDWLRSSIDAEGWAGMNGVQK